MNNNKKHKQTIIYKWQHTKLKPVQHDPLQELEKILDAAEVLAYHASELSHKWHPLLSVCKYKLSDKSYSEGHD